MNEFAGVMSENDLHNLKSLSLELKKYHDEFLPIVSNMLANDWRRVRELLGKIINDQRKIDTLYIETEKIQKQIKEIVGEK